MFGGGDAGGMGPGDMEASFKEFLNRPENAAVLEKQQRKEFRQALQMREKASAIGFRDKVLESEYDAQKNIAPFLQNRVLRRIVQTFTNDPSGDFSKWANNPRVIEMLRESKRLMDEGYLREDEVEECLIRQLQDPSHAAHADFKRHSQLTARLPTDQLVGALNEHLTERRAGNAAYRAGDYPKAMHHYERAKAVVEFVQGLSRMDQAELDVNKGAVYLNLAAVHMALGEHGRAVDYCGKALTLDPCNAKALLRRSRAHTARHDYEAAAADLERLRQLDPLSVEAEEQALALARARQADRRKEKSLFADMFSRGALEAAGAGTAS